MEEHSRGRSEDSSSEIPIRRNTCTKTFVINCNISAEDSTRSRKSELISKRRDRRYIQNGRAGKMDRKNGLMDDYEQDRQVAHTLWGNKRSNGSLPNVIHFADDEGNNIDLLYFPETGKRKREQTYETEYRDSTTRSRFKINKKISIFFCFSQSKYNLTCCSIHQQR